ncbi:guanylate kinase [candidate division WOR-3 bacterium]|nr:guanylate kinase [candidate division WOR-3 bacterium]
MILIIAGPSGAGKTTVCKLLVKNDDKLLYSISATTRKKRRGEKDGVDYYFIDEKKFKNWEKKGRFLETAKVHGYYYGTLKDFVAKADKDGREILLDVDVKGKINICKKMNNAVSIFLLPPTMTEAVKRIKGRNVEKDIEIKKRMETATREVKEIKNFDYLVVNEDLKATVKVIKSIIVAERHRVKNKIGGKR